MAVWAAGPAGAASYFDGHLAVISVAWKPLVVERAGEHDFGVGLERVGDDAGVVGAQHLAVALHVEPPLQRVVLAPNRVGHDGAVDLQVLAVPRRRLGHHLVHVLVVLQALAERAVQQHAERSGEHHAGETDLRGFVTHR